MWKNWPTLSSLSLCFERPHSGRSQSAWTRRSAKLSFGNKLCCWRPKSRHGKESMHKCPDVSVVIINYEQYATTVASTKILRQEASTESTEIVVVDASGC